MNYVSVCAGIEAASVAWHPLGWRCVAHSEIDPFPCAVLAHHYPSVPNLGDMTKFKEWPDAAIDVFVGGTPCQSFSVAGLRKGLADPRGNLMLTYGAIAAKYRPRWLVWENVPGVLSSNGGRDFGAFLGMLAELGYGFAYRVLDAQYFGLAQRRKRVFVVGCLGDWRRAAAVLFERSSLRGDPAPSREARERVARPIAACSPGGSGDRNDADTADNLIPQVANPLTARMHKGVNTTCDEGQTMIALTFDTTQITHPANRSNPQPGDPYHPLAAGAHAPAIAFDTYNQSVTGDTVQTLCSRGDTPGGNAHLVPAVAFDARQSDVIQYGDKSGSLDTAGHTFAVQRSMQVRRLTPRECERLQGFPDDYTLIPYRGKPAADGPRYKALGNSMAVPVMAWIGRRIQMVEQIQNEQEAA